MLELDHWCGLASGLFAVSLGEHVEEFDVDRERDGEIDVAAGDMELETVGDQRDAEPDGGPKAGAFFLVIIQIIIIDMVFSLDSIITAIGMASELAIMIAAVVIACIVMYASSGPVARFVAEHPTTKMLALAFLVLIGVALVADGFEFHIPRGYIYFAIAFSAAVEFFNVLAKRNRKNAAR